MHGKADLMSKPDGSNASEILLFDAMQMQWLGRNEAVAQPSSSDEEQPWLEPVWRNSSGEFQRVANFRIIYRWFAKTMIHEKCFVYAGQPTLRCFDGQYDQAGHYYRDQLRNYLRYGWPKPKEGATIECVGTRGEQPINSVLIYCDDLFLCPTCGTFHGEVDGSVLESSWLRHFDEIDLDALHKFLDENRTRPEFRFKACKGSDCEEYRYRIVQEIAAADAAAANRPALSALMLSAPEANVQSVAPRQLDKSGYVYVIGGDGHFKIGIAFNVKKRMSSLQTSCPFRLTLINEWKHDEARIMEGLLHQKYQAFHSSGEWFKLTTEEIQKIRDARKPENLFSEGEIESLTATNSSEVED